MAGLELRIQVVGEFLNDLIAFPFGKRAFAFQLIRVDLPRARMLTDLGVHLRLGEHRLVAFVMSMPAITPHIDDNVLLEALPVFDRNSRDMHAGFRVVPIDVEDRCVDQFCHVRTIRRGP